MKLFIDTNILFDYAFPLSPHHAPAKQLIDLSPELGHELITSPYSYLTAFYSLRKHLRVEHTAAFLLQMSKRVLIQDTSLSEQIPLHLLAIASAGKGDLEDLCQQDIAVKSGADVIITRDLQFIVQCEKVGIMAIQADLFLASQ